MNNFFTEEEKERYARHFLLDGFGEEGQGKLKNARVLIVGTGGLGSPVALYLAAAGVGQIGIVDDDVVAASNLQRQVIHDTSMIDQPKVVSAKRRLVALNPLIKIAVGNERLIAENAQRIISAYDLVVDGTDNFQSRYIINKACVELNKPWISGSIFKYDGQVSVFNWQGGPCYCCLYPEPPAPDEVPPASKVGVLGVLPGVIGSIQATEAIKLITGIGKPLSKRLLLYNSLDMQFMEVDIMRDPGCKCCGRTGI
ncbi:molybdopterin-synthase adenylyltransferase MoeB [Marinilabiliaceae bacterium JC017]|nr:molybdopterin-synthase adenylyltransferase MoeB [Marinilabiliaceae bacterium JC017]